MKRIVVILLVAAMVSSASIGYAEEEKEKTLEVEVAAGVASGYIDLVAGQLWYDKPVSIQHITLLSKLGLYAHVANYSPFTSEMKETDMYLGYYKEFWGMSIETGYAYYMVHKAGELSYHALYAEMELPKIWWQITSFVRGEYRIATGKAVQTDEDGNIQRTSQDGFLYFGGLKREFKLSDSFSLEIKGTLGGNTGLYGMPAENLAFLREQITLSYALDKHWSVKGWGMTQQNLGRDEGIATGTQKGFYGMSLVWTF